MPSRKWTLVCLGPVASSLLMCYYCHCLLAQVQLVQAVNQAAKVGQPLGLQQAPVPVVKSPAANQPTVNNNNKLSVNVAAQPEQHQQQQQQQTDQSSTSLANRNNQEDPVIYIDFSSINDEILRKRTVNLVYFNANFNHCKNCHRFMDIWRDLAVDIKWWRQVVRLFTINCSEDDNVEICRHAGVTQLPQVKYYWVMSNNLDQDGQRLRILGKSVHAMRHLIVDKLMESYLDHNKLLAQRSAQRSAATKANGGSSLAQNPFSPLVPLFNQLAAGGSLAKPGALNQLVTGLMGKGGPAGVNLNQVMQSIGGAQGVNQLIQAFMSAASLRKSLTIQPLAPNWPQLDQFNVSDTQRLLDMLPMDGRRATGALLIMETQEFLYTGLEVMLDLQPYANQTYLARVRDERSHFSRNLTGREDIQAPALIYVDETRSTKLIATAAKYTNDEDLRRAFVRAFERKQVKYPVKRIWANANEPGTGSANVDSSDNSENEDILKRLNEVYMNDLTNAIRASLMEQVFRHPDLSDDQYNALVKYVYVLINYFPFEGDDALKFLKRLHGWLQNQVSPMDIGEYKRQFERIDDVLPKRPWTACKSLANSKAIPSKGRKSGLFDNPAQLGKMVSNMTKLLRAGQQKAGQLKTLLSMFTNLSPVTLGDQDQQRWSSSASSSASSSSTRNRSPSKSGRSEATSTSTTTSSPQSSRRLKKIDGGQRTASKDESPIERVFKSLTSGSLGSDSSILKLIANTLSGASGAQTGDSSSQGKSKFAREYPCGAWRLAHVMVVNEYVKDSPRKDVKHIVLQSLFQYVLHFYACPTCGNRISDVASEFRLNLNDHLQDQGDSVMLLWKVHNRVNKRLESEIRPGSPPKQQFPGEQLCPKCRASRAPNDMGASPSTPSWQEKQILNFLVHHYRAQNILASSESPDSSSSSNILSDSWTLRVPVSAHQDQLIPILVFIWSTLAAMLIQWQMMITTNPGVG